MIPQQKGSILLPLQTARDLVNNHQGNNEIALLRNGIGQQGTKQDLLAAFMSWTQKTLCTFILIIAYPSDERDLMER